MHILTFKFAKSNVNSTETELPSVTYEPNLDMALKMLKLLFQINMNQRKNRLSYETFYLPELSDMVEIQRDFYRWTQSQGHSNEFFLCNYPFMFDAKAKTLLLQTDQAIQMHRAVMQAQQNLFFAALFSREPQNGNEFVVFNVTRENIVTDTIREICMCNVKDLKKPLKVKFFGEEAEDAGGVRKEFFLLLMKEILDQKYGMFQEYEESRLIWFASNSFEDPDMYSLVGTICGLAIYNFIIINLPFPLALYKKLLKEKVDISDLKELSPVLGRTLQNILDYEGDDMEEVFDLTFEISRESYGHLETVPLKVDGDKIRVNQSNKYAISPVFEYCMLNSNHYLILSDSIGKNLWTCTLTSFWTNRLKRNSMHFMLDSWEYAVDRLWNCSELTNWWPWLLAMKIMIGMNLNNRPNTKAAIHPVIHRYDLTILFSIDDHE